MHRPLFARRPGFTMIEALVVLTLIGIAATLALPAVGRTMATTRVQRASAVMATELKTAFALSAQQRRPILISVDGAARTFRVQSRDGAVTYLRTAYDGSSDLVLTQLSAEPASLVIFPSGLASGGMEITMQTTPTEVRVIRTTRAGQVRISQP
jgi:type II secretion system protein H